MKRVKFEVRPITTRTEMAVEECACDWCATR